MANSNNPKKHDFRVKQFPQPTFCDYCDEFIWGLNREGFFCEDCQHSVHKRCVRKAEKIICSDSSLDPSKALESEAQVSSSEGERTFETSALPSIVEPSMAHPKEELQTNYESESLTSDSESVTSSESGEDKSRNEGTTSYMMPGLPMGLSTMENDLKAEYEKYSRKPIERTLSRVKSQENLARPMKDSIVSTRETSSDVEAPTTSSSSPSPTMSTMPAEEIAKWEQKTASLKPPPTLKPSVSLPSPPTLLSPQFTAATSTPRRTEKSDSTDAESDGEHAPSVQTKTRQSSWSNFFGKKSSSRNTPPPPDDASGPNPKHVSANPAFPSSILRKAESERHASRRSLPVASNNTNIKGGHRTSSVSGASYPNGPPSPGTPVSPKWKQTLGIVDHNLISDLNLLLVRGETRKFKKTVTKMLNKSSLRQLLFQATDVNGDTILHVAVERYPALIKPLFEKKINPNRANLNDNTPLAYAAMKGDENIFQELLNLGALPDAQALHYVCAHFCSNQCNELMATILKMSPTLTVDCQRHSSGDSLLHTAVINNRNNVVDNLEGATLFTRILLGRGAHVNASNAKGDSPLHWAIYTDKSKVLIMQILAGGILEAKGSEGLDCYELANRTPQSATATCIRHIKEAKQILTPLSGSFHSTEGYQFILSKFIEEEIGEQAFKALTLETIQELGIKNTGNIAVLMSAQEKLKAKDKEGLHVRRNSEFTQPPEEVEKQIGHVSIALFLEMCPNGCQTSMEAPQVLNAHRRRLQVRLEQFNLRMRKTYAEFELYSNSLFCAASDQLFDNIEQAQEIRDTVMRWLGDHKDWVIKEGGNSIKLSSFLRGMVWDGYVRMMEEAETWGDMFCLIAISEIYGCKVFMISSAEGDNFIMQYVPSQPSNRRTLMLGHIMELHFHSLAQVVENPTAAAWNQDFNIEYSDLKFQSKIGKGSSGVISKGLWKGTQVAIKKISRSLIDSSHSLDTFRAEINMLKRFRHPNIILFMGISMREDHVFIITEYMERGSLKSLISQQYNTFNWPQKIKMALDIVGGMHYLHSLKPIVIHRDLKSSNILVDKSFNLKVTDFGVARLFEDKDQFLHTFCSTVAWTAPEIFNAAGYTEKVDVYGFGIVLWELSSGRVPFNNFSEQQVILGVSQKNLRPEIVPDTPEPIVELMRQCWSANPNTRPSFEEILKTLHEIAEFMKEETPPTSVENSPIVTQRLRGSTTSVIDVTEKLEESEDMAEKFAERFWAIDFRELHYSPNDLIGSGKSANVYKGTYRHQVVAIKVFTNTPDAEQLIEFKKELQILSTVRTPNLAYFYGGTITPKCCIVLEHFPMTLYDFLNDPKIEIDWTLTMQFAREIANGCHFLHSWKPPVVHRDIKSSNMLVDISRKSIKLCDLGLARFSSSPSDITFRKGKGTPSYMAPEVYTSALRLDEELSNGLKDPPLLPGSGFTTKSDVYSYAIVLWEMTMRTFMGEYKIPYFSDNKNLKHDASILIQVATNSLRPKLRPEIPASLQSLIEWCWQQDPEQRPSFETICEHLTRLEQDIQKKPEWKKCYLRPPKM
eukprot:TRINITY_DN575_c0_g1_i1.p1 TRINITY_DN575_c0_g1~~TRINITY_DN575_c0_g1_i1.p1  ORF type:complete len:1549 (+),score=441.45 TRINITY_DN575_c0_g1_i1:27-4673(+)